MLKLTAYDASKCSGSFKLSYRLQSIHLLILLSTISFVLSPYYDAMERENYIIGLFLKLNDLRMNHLLFLFTPPKAAVPNVFSFTYLLLRDFHFAAFPFIMNTSLRTHITLFFLIIHLLSRDIQWSIDKITLIFLTFYF